MNDAALKVKPYVPGAREEYLADCESYHHWPRCESPAFCGMRRDLDAAVKAQRVTRNEATRFLRRRLKPW